MIIEMAKPFKANATILDFAGTFPSDNDGVRRLFVRTR